MKKIVYIAAALVVFAACTKEKEAPTVNGEFTLTATMELPNDATKTAMSGTSVVWSGSEHINVFTDAGENIEFSTTESGASAIFTTASVPTGTPKYAIYPYSAGNEIAGSNITFTLPETQTYAANSFGPGANVSVGAIDGGTGTVTFYNTCGVLKLSLSIASGDAANVGRIELTDENNMLAGTFTADASLIEPTATYTGSDGSHTITLDCSAGSGVALSTTATDFYIVVPAGACSSGFTAKVYSKQNHLITTLSTTKNNTVARKTIMVMPPVSNIPWLPAAYTECEYIQTPGDAFINTGVLVNDEFQVDMRMALTEIPTTAGIRYYVPIGTWNGSKIAWIRLIYTDGIPSSAAEYKWATGSDITFSYPGSSYYTADKIVDISWVNKLTVRSIRVNNVYNQNTTVLAESPNSLTYPLYLFRANWENRIDGNNAYAAKMKLYACAFRNGSDVVVRNFIPAYNGEKYGLYEVSEQATYSGSYFYTSPNDVLFSGH